MKKRGKTVVIQARVEPETYGSLVNYCRQQNCTISEVIREIIQLYCVGDYRKQGKAVGANLFLKHLVEIEQQVSQLKEAFLRTSSDKGVQKPT